MEGIGEAGLIASPYPTFKVKKYEHLGLGLISNSD
jgi:hypothetical protein